MGWEVKTPDTPFLQAAALLPLRLRRAAEGLAPARQRETEELRLRAGLPLTAVWPEGERTIPGSGGTVRPEELDQVLEIATRASAHTALDQVRSGFVTVRGGHRIGICGRAVVKDGTVTNLRELSSLCVRVARAVPGAAKPILAELAEGGRLLSTLILSPPGGGKTTLLRDIVRAASDGDGLDPVRVGVADERSEVAAMYAGEPQFHVGRRTDVMDGCPKETGLLMLLRGMDPQVLAADEITAPGDCAALQMAANCGVTLLATAHGADLEDLERRPLYRGLLEQNIFRRVVTIRRESGARRYTVTTLEGRPC